MMFFRALYWKKLLIASFVEYVHLGEYCKKNVCNTFFDQI